MSAALERRDIARGALWRVAEVAGAELSAFCAFVVLARLLHPEAFGIVSLASLFILIAQLVLSQGLGEALIQAPDVSPGRLATALWANTGIGLAAALLLMVAAGGAAAVLQEPGLAPILRALAPTLVLFGISGILQAKLRRDLQMRGFALSSITATICGGLVGAGCALAGLGVWSLVAQQWTYAIVSVTIFALYGRWRPQLDFSLAELRRLWAFGSRVVASAVLRFAMRRIDLLILGLFLPTVEVGYYFLANRLMFSVGMFSYYSMQQIGLPVLAKLQHQPEEQRAAIFKTMRLVSLLCLPLLVLLGLAADPLVPLLFGANWWGSVAAFRVLCCLNIFYALSLMAGQVLLSAGYPAAYMRLAAGNVAIFLVCVTIAAPYGIVAAALAGGLANMLAVPLYFLALRRILGISLRRLAVEQLPAWFAVGVMALAVLGLGSLFGAAPGVPQLLMTLLAGGAVFVGVMAVIAREQIGDLVASVAAAGSRSESS